MTADDACAACREAPAANDVCAVCRDTLADRADRWRPLPCVHWFHRACIDDALRVRTACPTCRHSLDGIVSFDKGEVVAVRSGGGRFLLHLLLPLDLPLTLLAINSVVILCVLGPLALVSYWNKVVAVLSHFFSPFLVLFAAIARTWTDLAKLCV
jgi:hypothetical protein